MGQVFADLWAAITGSAPSSTDEVMTTVYQLAGAGATIIALVIILLVLRFFVNNLPWRPIAFILALIVLFMAFGDKLKK
jgi:hypothetical protein